MKASFYFSKVAVGLMMGFTYMSLAVVFGIVFILAVQSFFFFQKVPLSDVFFSFKWSLQENHFGIWPLLAGTFLVVGIALCTALPISMLASVYLTEYCPKKYAYRARPFLEVLTGIPTVVYGFFAIVLIAPFIKDLGMMLGIRASGESALAAGITMGLMLIPFMVSLLSDTLAAVPSSLRDGAYALGATKTETIWHIVLPAALSDIIGVILLTLSRGIGETMIVVMAAGLAANITLEPFKSVTTVTVQIVSILLGDQDYGNPKTLAAFMLGFLLFLLTLLLNMIALSFMRSQKKRYE